MTQSRQSGDAALNITRKLTELIWAVSISVATALLIIGFFISGGDPTFDEFIFFASVAAIFPSSILNFIGHRRRKNIDEHLPDLFRSIAQAQETGMTLPQALENTARRNYGPLTVELRKMNRQISWGMPFEEALSALGGRVNTVLMRRTIPMIIEASRSGGHAEKVFEPMGRFIQSTLVLEKERRNQTRPYVAIIYIAFFVFIFTIVILFKSLFAGIQDLPTLADPTLLPEQMRQIFFRMMMIQAFFGGIVAGKMSEGTMSAGLKHALIMMLCGYIALKVFL